MRKMSPYVRGRRGLNNRSEGECYDAEGVLLQFWGNLGRKIMLL